MIKIVMDFIKKAVAKRDRALGTEIYESIRMFEMFSKYVLRKKKKIMIHPISEQLVMKFTMMLTVTIMDDPSILGPPDEALKAYKYLQSHCV